MISVYFLIFSSLVMGAIFALVFVWAVKANQFKDVEAPKYEMLRDDDEYEDD
jgi:cbb3-type cytochrome oxidase maturation protein